MPSLIEIKKEIGNNPVDTLKKYVNLLYEHTDRNVIVYSSGWLNVSSEWPVSINDKDMNGFMAMTYGMDLDKGLDLILHTPGGSVAATESIINYIYRMFNGNVRALIPQLAMSGGTMIACSCKEIIMGKQSSFGPIDPQILGVPAQALIDEFVRAKKEIEENPSCVPLWQSIISQYTPTLLDSCQHAINWSKEILQNSLEKNMFNNETEVPIPKIMDTLASHKKTKAHDRHLSADKCREIGLKVSFLEDDDKLQDYVLSIHHCSMEIFERMNVYKIFCNQNSHLNYMYD